MAIFKVLREHIGDKPYVKGELRTANPSDVAHLVQSGVLELATKVEPEPKNKDSVTPKNKSSKSK